MAQLSGEHLSNMHEKLKKIWTLFDSEILLLGIYLKEIIKDPHKDLEARVFNMALVTTVKNWKTCLTLEG